MSSRSLNGAALWLAIACAAHGEQRVLRVCADPNNMPFSNERQEGFENRIAALAARELGAKLEYTWWSERKSFIEHSLNQGLCDAVMGIPSEMPGVAVTRPYYRSTYVFVSRRDRGLTVTSLGDERLSGWKIGMHVVGDDYAPPAAALARRGLAANITGYSLFGAAGEVDPPSKLVSAVERGDVDLAVVWGPFAGYFAKRSTVPLDIVPVSPAVFFATPFTFAISAGVREGDQGLRKDLDEVLARECSAIENILAEYGVPRADRQEGDRGCVESRGSRSAVSR